MATLIATCSVSAFGRISLRRWTERLWSLRRLFSSRYVGNIVIFIIFITTAAILVVMIQTPNLTTPLVTTTTFRNAIAVIKSEDDDVKGKHSMLWLSAIFEQIQVIYSKWWTKLPTTRVVLGIPNLWSAQVHACLWYVWLEKVDGADEQNEMNEWCIDDIHHPYTVLYKKGRCPRFGEKPPI